MSEKFQSSEAIQKHHSLLSLNLKSKAPPRSPISSNAAPSSFSFEDDFDIIWAEDNFKTSNDGQVWYLSLDKQTGCGFQTKQRYRFGWFSMKLKLKLVGGDSAGVVTAYYMCSDLDAAPERDELDFEFLGNRSGQPYTIQTNVYKSGVGGREIRHMLWFDPTEDFHTYSILWNNHQIAASYLKMAEELCGLLESKPGESSSLIVHINCFETMLSAPVPEDLRSCHLQDALSVFTYYLLADTTS